MFSLFRKKIRYFFSQEENERIVAAIKAAEQQTSGEIRIYIESHCRFVDPVDRALEVFYGLKMEQTAQRNGVLLYIALQDHQLAIYGDEGIHQKVGGEFWNEEVKHILSEFNANHFADGIVLVVKEIGEALKHHFPYDGDTDKNELPDDIVFGR
ncbi:MAG: TPM domain-containing protein [Chitinophagaceae bacterium]|nr:TPM domain-containing protein [Chitinophagaceae bacterium]MCW5928348.1 TPM domain-containing protein [Chitinophagaceae bacterium]